MLKVLRELTLSPGSPSSPSRPGRLRGPGESCHSPPTPQSRHPPSSAAPGSHLVGPVQICLRGELLSRAQPAAESGPCRSEPRNSCDPEGENQSPKSPEEKGRLAEGLALRGDHRRRGQPPAATLQALWSHHRIVTKPCHVLLGRELTGSGAKSAGTSGMGPDKCDKGREPHCTAEEMSPQLTFL